MGLFDERVAYKPFEYPEYYTEGWLKQAQAFWLHTEISMQSDIKDWNEKLNKKKNTLLETSCSALLKQNAQCQTTGPKKSLAGFQSTKSARWQ